MAPTMPRPIRVPDAEWQAALAAARAMGETLTDVVRRALRTYVAAQSITANGDARILDVRWTDPGESITVEWIEE